MPGMGSGFVEELRDYYHTKAGSIYLAANGDVARTFRFEGKIWPLDYYILQKLREELGLPLRSVQRQGKLASEDQPAGPPIEFMTDEEYNSNIEISRKAHVKLYTKRGNHGYL